MLAAPAVPTRPSNSTSRRPRHATLLLTNLVFTVSPTSPPPPPSVLSPLQPSVISLKVREGTPPLPVALRSRANVFFKIFDGEKKRCQLHQRERRPSGSTAGENCITVDGQKDAWRCQYVQIIRPYHFFSAASLFAAVSLIQFLPIPGEGGDSRGGSAFHRTAFKRFLG